MEFFGFIALIILGAPIAKGVGEYFSRKGDKSGVRGAEEVNRQLAATQQRLAETESRLMSVEERLDFYEKLLSSGTKPGQNPGQFGD